MSFKHECSCLQFVKYDHVQLRVVYPSSLFNGLSYDCSELWVRCLLVVGALIMGVASTQRPMMGPGPGNHSTSGWAQ
jgi:hypothetical protein